MTTLLNTESVQEMTIAWCLQSANEMNGMPKRIPVLGNRFQVGRRTDASFCIPHPSVSKNHAELISTDVALFVRDLGSTNGTFVNGQQISQDTLVGEEDVLRFADFEFLVCRAHREHVGRTLVSSPAEWKSQLTQFHRLLTDRSVTPYFQPIIRFSDTQRIGFEVLARSSVVGLTNPKELFGTAERFSLASRLSVLCREQGVAFAKCLATPGRLFLNTHPSEQPQAGLVEALTELRNRAPDMDLVLELHEAAVTNPSEIMGLRSALRDLKIQLAYDDFGAGQARLMELSEVAPDFLKFDISLIRDIHLSPQRQHLVAGLVQIVREMGIQSLAEGIEVSEEAEVCRQIGFDHAQGYYFGKPAPAETISE